ncbi:outer envelope pore protein 16 chloroplastic-like [Trifolium medium]|uniref:Outer envelope pore protein 16 chloroplastic-like n=1 Tax=Trifolium medium TaxID=97028 RepID=A0A392PM37_9FABA|nr:outer envelope pore protein 16 chloroplastic-like [Trifolium medium]
MPVSSISGSVSSPQVDVVIDTGNPYLNLTVDGFLKIGTVAATRALAEDTYHIVRKSEYFSTSATTLLLK